MNPGRKYTPVLTKLVAEGICRVQCSARDSPSVIEGVKKEKVRWVKRKLWPLGKALRIEAEDTGLTFRIVLDTSIRNL